MEPLAGVGDPIQSALSTHSEYPRKFVLQRPITYPHQRSGWNYAMASLARLMSAGHGGILLDAFIEKNFYSRLREAQDRREIPYLRPWVGFVHSPPERPPWYDPGKSLRCVSLLPAWQRSLPYCKGLLTVSEWLRDQLLQIVDVPVLALKHPTEVPTLPFSMERFRSNPRRRIIQVGGTLRRLGSIHELPVRTLCKTMIDPLSGTADHPRFLAWLEAERRSRDLPPVPDWDVEILARESNQEYDRRLSENLIFLHLHPSGACNTVIECLVRNTPVLVNPVETVVEYLGESYPLYFRTLEEAAEKAEDVDLIQRAHVYLAGRPKDWLSGEYFCRSLAESAFYRAL